MGLPILSRLDLADYFRLTYAFFILMMDKLLRFIWPLVPSYRKGHCKQHDKFARLRDTMEMIEYFDESVEEHITFTMDGYLLMLFKIKTQQANKKSLPPILLLHGTMLSSDIWMIHREKHKNLPMFLHALGYEVWLGNRRGNKYCAKHSRLRTRDAAFWDYSIDEVALHDIPCMVDYILRTSSIKKCIVMGFSQGSAEIFAALSLNASLNDKIALVVGLAAMTRPAPFVSGGPSIISALSHGPPELLYLLFGRRALLPSVLFWMEALPCSVYANLIDFFLHLLFGWTCKNIKSLDRQHMYLKLYSYCSVKTIAHWFQMSRAKRFQMFDDAAAAYEMSCFGGSERRPGHVPTAFPLKQVNCPIVLFNGSEDTLPDTEYTKKHLFHCIAEDIIIEGYEHLDFLMAFDVDQTLFPLIESCLSKLRLKKTINQNGTQHSRESSELSVKSAQRL